MWGSSPQTWGSRCTSTVTSWAWRSSESWTSSENNSSSWGTIRCPSRSRLADPTTRRSTRGSQTGLYHLAFTVDDVAALVERLKSEGVPIALEPLSTQPDRLVAFVEDPDGAFIQLIQMLT